MKKNFKLLIIILFAFVVNGFGIIKVDAVREICTSKAYSDMVAKAYKTTFSYDLKFDNEGVPYFEITYANLDEGIEIRYGENVYKYDAKNSSGKIKTLFQNTGKTYSFELYAEYGYPCVGELLYTKQVTLPKYNKYSQYEECIEYEEFPLCKKWYNGEIENEKYFYDKLNEYILSIAPPKEPEVEPGNKSTFEKIISFYLDNLIFTLPITILLVLVSVFLIVRKIIINKRRVKVGI